MLRAISAEANQLSDFKDAAYRSGVENFAATLDRRRRCFVDRYQKPQRKIASAFQPQPLPLFSVFRGDFRIG